MTEDDRRQMKAAAKRAAQASMRMTAETKTKTLSVIDKLKMQRRNERNVFFPCPVPLPPYLLR